MYSKQETTRRLPNIQQHRRSFLQNLIDCFLNYSDATTIHGFNYLTERGRSVLERICWLIAMVISVSICVFLILGVYQKWVGSPVIVTFANGETSVFEIPFPAVTVCPEVKADRFVFNYTDIYLKKMLDRPVTDTEEKHFEYMSLICQTKSNLINVNETTVGDEALDYIVKVGPHMENYGLGSTWMASEFDNAAKNLFSPVLTEEGLCYTFNMIDSSELFTDIVKYPKQLLSSNGKRSNWFPDTGYSKDAPVNAYPMRTPIAGAHGGLLLELRFLHDHFDYACGNSVQGYKITLHQPTEFPRVKENYFRLSADHAAVAAITPNLLTTSSDLKDYKPQDRKCYFTSEKSLKFFRIYTQQNCFFECLINLTLSMCGCVGFHMPREKSIPICAASGKECMAEAKRSGYRAECDCQPSCYSLKFDVETSYTTSGIKERSLTLFELGKIDKETYLNYADEDRYSTAELLLFLKQTLFVKSERNELYGEVDFWANIGGILGLFTGFSFLSLCEIFYYMSLRLFYNSKMYGPQYWAGAPNIPGKSRP